MPTGRPNLHIRFERIRNRGSREKILETTLDLRLDSSRPSALIRLLPEVDALQIVNIDRPHYFLIRGVRVDRNLESVNAALGSPCTADILVRHCLHPPRIR